MGRRKKIIFVTPSLKTGGGNRVFVELANELCAQFDVSIIAPNNSSDQHTFNLNERINIKSIGKSATGKISKVFNLFRTISYLNKHHRDDIVVCSDPIFCLFLWRLKAKSLYRFIQADDYRIFDDGAILGHGLVLKVFKRLTLRSYRAKRVEWIFNSQYVYSQFCSDAKRNDVALKLVHPALNHNIFNDKSRSSGVDGVTICLVARKHPSKGLAEFISVYRGLSDVYRGDIPSVKLVSHDDLSGFDLSGIEVVVPQSDSDIVDVYSAGDIYVSTSWREGFGLPPLEAMACGCAVISSRSGGVDEYAVDGQNCLMFEPRNEEQLQSQLIRLIGDANLRQKLAQQGVATASNFTWANAAEQFITIIAPK